MTSGTTPVPIEREPELLGQTVVVIGGSAGIGLETARRARAEGAEVILTGRDPDRLKQAALGIDAQRTAAFDANDTASVQKFFSDCRHRSTMYGHGRRPELRGRCSRWTQTRCEKCSAGTWCWGSRSRATPRGR